MGAPLLGLQTYAIKEPSGENDGKLPFTMMEDKFSNGNVTDSTQRSTEGVDKPSGWVPLHCGTWFHLRMKKQKGCNDAHLL